MSQSMPGRLGCFGKLPSHADFIGINAHDETVRALDGWLQRSLVDWAETEPHWVAQFDALPLNFFSFVDAAGHGLLGGMISSQDASGRRYPFFVFQRLEPSIVAQTEGLGLHTLAETLSGQMRSLLINAVHGGLQPEQVMDHLRPMSTQDVSLYQQVHMRFLQDFSFADIAASLQRDWPEFIPEATLHRLAALMMRWREQPERGMALLPLPAERGLKRSVADLWLRWLQRGLPTDSYGLSGHVSKGHISKGHISKGHNGPEYSSWLLDDFMRPQLLIVPPSSRAVPFFRALQGSAADSEVFDVLASFTVDEPHPGHLQLPDMQQPLHEFTAVFPGQKPVEMSNGWSL
ncbi:type VI secretion system-associated protein TagF [Terasakiispira papahanaumokuakeensis]|nr:type VI secretion system-associated protein TagF [Terasakiispira papahanaumokuakeensis]